MAMMVWRSVGLLHSEGKGRRGSTEAQGYDPRDRFGGSRQHGSGNNAAGFGTWRHHKAGRRRHDPGDVRLLSLKELFVSQGGLTGESLPLEKFCEPTTEMESSPTELKNTYFMGTNVESGATTAVVVTTGLHTYFGSIGPLRHWGSAFGTSNRQI